MAVCACGVMFAQTPVWDGSVADSFAGGTGTEEDPYQIATPAQLAKLAQDVNNEITYEGKYFVLTSDLDLGGENKVQWVPVGKGYNQAFGGIFDGKGMTISNLYVSLKEKTSDYIGLFGSTSNKSEIRNVVVDGSIDVDASLVGGIVGYFNGVMEDCLSFVRIDAKASDIGGCAGSNYGIIRRNMYAGKIQGSAHCAGIAGSSRGEIEECVNLGLVTTTDLSTWTFFGGIAGSNTGKLTNSINAGSVVAVGDAGGVVGSQHFTGTISDCLNLGAVYGVGRVGAVIGAGEGTSNLYFDVQASSGLMTGDEYYDNNENRRYLTSQLISGFVDGLEFTDNSKWLVQEGRYPQLRCFAESENELFRQLSALAAVPVSTRKFEAFSALQDGFDVPAKMQCGSDEYELEYVSSVPDILSFNGMECTFNAPAEDTDIEFYVGVKGTDYRKYVCFPFYGIFQEVETPAYSDDEGMRVYTLKNFANMAWFNGVANGFILSDEDRNAMPKYTSFNETVVRMGADIDIEGRNWIPIGGISSSLRFFGGQFDGCGYTVKNLVVDMPEEDNVAMFGYMGGNGSGISNVRLEGGRVVGSNYVAGLVAEGVLSSFEGCHNVSCNVEAEFFAGGLFSTVTACSITNCANNANVNCTNNGAGGVVFDFNSADNSYVTCAGCYNTGKVYANGGYAGGIASMIGTYSTIMNCFNVGEIGGDNDVIGGIAAGLGQDGKLANCYNAGKVKRPEGYLGKMNMGEILGITASEDITNAFYNFEIAENMGGIADSDSYGTEGFATEEMQNNEKFVDMLGAGVWVMDTEGINNGYPILAWMSKAGVESPVIAGDGEGMKIYPTPCVDVIYVNGPDVCRIEVYDMSGKMVLSAEVAEGCGIDVSALAGGVYAVYGYDADGEAEVSKMIKR